MNRVMRRVSYRGAVVCMLAWVAACGKISFGEDLGPRPDVGVVEPDAGEIPDVPDVGPPPDTGVVDTGEPPVDGGEPECLPVTLPPTPNQWPFGTDRAAYEGVFWTWAESQPFKCSSGACHGGDTLPRIPTGASLGDEYRRGIDELWPYLSDHNTEYSGRLWRHHPSYDGPGGLEMPEYTNDQTDFLKNLVHSVWACAAAPALERQDAGPGCGMGAPPPEPDAGVEPDAGDEDGGDEDAAQADAGTTEPADAGDVPPCYCDIPDVGPLGTEHCAP